MAHQPPTAHGPFPDRASFAGIPIEGIEQPAPSLTVGETLTYTFIIENRFDNHHSKIDAHDLLNRLRDIEAYGRRGGDYTTNHLDDGRYQFVDESHPDDPSPLVRFETPLDSDVESCYGLVESVELAGPISSNSAGQANGPIFVDVTLFCLAPLSEYRSRAELRSDLEAPGL